MQTATERVRKTVRERERTGQGTATVERLLKAGEDGCETTQSGVQRINQAPLDRLWALGQLNAWEFNAGDTFRKDAYLAAIDPAAMTVDWNRAGGGGMSSRVPSMFSHQTMADARIRHRRMEKLIEGFIFEIAERSLVKEWSLEQIGQRIFARHDPREAVVAGQAGFVVMLAALGIVYRM